MPIYEYECRACGHHLEKLQKISDPLLSDCPQCGKPELTKLVSAAGFRLKGGGWYETDFKNKSPKQDTGKPKDSDAQGKSDTAKSDTKSNASKTGNKTE